MISEWTVWPSAQPWGINWLVCPSAWPRPPSQCFHCLSVRPSVSLTETPVCNQRQHISFGRPTHNLVAAQQRPWQIGSDALPVPAWSRPGPLPNQPTVIPVKTDRTNTPPVRALPYHLVTWFHQPQGFHVSMHRFTLWEEAAGSAPATIRILSSFRVRKVG